MIKVMFICHGNICRSPMAEFILKDMVEKIGAADNFLIASCATSREEIWGGVGNPVYPPAKEELAKHGISCEGKRAVQLRREDYEKYDYLLPESVKFKLQNKAERLINTAFLAKTLMSEFAPNGCGKSYMIKCLKHWISCGFQAFLYNQVSRIQVLCMDQTNIRNSKRRPCKNSQNFSESDIIEIPSQTEEKRNGIQGNNEQRSGNTYGSGKHDTRRQ